MKNQKGVTLIALVVTIIVLIILAGVAIAALTGQNGVISRSREAKMLQIQGEVGDRITLALTAAKLYSEKKATASSSYFASQNLNGDIKTLIETELPGTYSSGSSTRAYLYSATPAATNTQTAGTGTITITYQTTAYEQATNVSKAAIIYTIQVDGNSFKVTNVQKDDEIEDPSPVLYPAS